MSDHEKLTAEPQRVVLQRDPSATAVVDEMRLSELDMISTRLGRLCGRTMHWDQFFGVLASVLIGGVVGGGLGLIPFYGQDPAPRGYLQAIYLLSLGAALLLAVVCFAAWIGIKRERTESVQHVKDDLDQILATYQPDRGS